MDKQAAAMHEATDIGTKLTEAQIRALQASGGLLRCRLVGDCWARDKQGHIMRVRRLTFNKLEDLGLIAIDRTERSTDYYAVTEAGSALLRSLQEKSNG